MKRAAIFLAVLCAFFSMASFAMAQEAANVQGTAKADGDSFMYADFENVKDKRPFSNRDGYVQLTSYQESTPSHFKGLADSSPPAPEAVRLKPDDPNHAIAFDYELYSPNQYAGVGVEIHGQADKDGKPVADDLSAYKFVTMQIYATGVSNLRVEIISRGQGISLSSGFPQMSFKVKPGFNIYKIPLSSLSQPSWAQTKVGAKDVLKKLTVVSLTAYCEQCTPVHGTVVVDNIMFQK
jgi:hypothetical protein